MSEILFYVILECMQAFIRISIYSFFFFVYALIYTGTTASRDKQTDLALQQQIDNLENNYKISTNGFEQLSNTLYSIVVNQPEIIDILYKAKHAKTEEERSVLRQRLYERMRPYFEQATRAGLRIMLFSFEDNRCFLRVHKPGKFNDDLSSVRYSFTYVNENKKGIRGFEQGKISHAFRNIFPISHNGEYLGSVDFAFSSEILQENMTRSHGIDTHFILNKSVFDVNIWEAQKVVKYIQAIEHEDFLFALTPSQTENAFASEKIYLNETLKEKIDRNIGHGGPFAFYHHMREEYDSVHIITFWPIKNIKEGKTVAYLVSYSDSYYIDGLLHKYLWVNILSFIGLLLLAYITANNVDQRFSLQERVKKEVEKNRRQQQSMLVQSRLAQMGEMISMIAHQWRQPLASISSISGTLSADVMLGNYKKEVFEERRESITELIQHLSSTIDDFRKFFAEDKKEVSCTLEEIADGSLDIVGAMIKNTGIAISTDYQCNEQLMMYPNECKQVVLNLVKNAQEALQEKKRDDARIEIKTYKDDKKCYLEVADNAGGIPEEIMERIFEPYFTTKGELNGTGLGLYMSHIIINEHHKGKLSVRNRDEGACFTIELPGRSPGTVENEG